jgi:hypothetical protein
VQSSKIALVWTTDFVIRVVQSNKIALLWTTDFVIKVVQSNNTALFGLLHRENEGVRLFRNVVFCSPVDVTSHTERLEYFGVWTFYELQERKGVMFA